MTLSSMYTRLSCNTGSDGVLNAHADRLQSNQGNQQATVQSPLRQIGQGEAEEEKQHFAGMARTACQYA